MSRRERQLDQLRDLCRDGAVMRAIDLAFEHFAQFGRDDAVLDLLEEVTQDEVSHRVRQRLTDLQSQQR